MRRCRGFVCPLLALLWMCPASARTDAQEKVPARNVHQSDTSIDFRSGARGHGKIVCVKIVKVMAGPDQSVTVPTLNEWRTAEGQKVLDESRTIRWYPLEGANANLFIVDIELTASVCPITFGDTK